jgi:hypothetical protein
MNSVLFEPTTKTGLSNLIDWWGTRNHFAMVVKKSDTGGELW